VTVIAFVGLASIAPAHCDDVVAPQVAALAAQLDPRVPETLARLDGTDRQLLALVASPGFPADRPGQARQAFRKFLSSHTPVPVPIGKPRDGLRNWMQPCERRATGSSAHWHTRPHRGTTPTCR